MLKRIVNTNKTYYDHLSKFGKALGKEFQSKSEYEEPLFKDYNLDKEVLNKAISEHMYRAGYFASGEKFTEEAGINEEESGNSMREEIVEEFKSKFKRLNMIIKEFRDFKRVKSAKQWATDNALQLN